MQLKGVRRKITPCPGRAYDHDNLGRSIAVHVGESDIFDRAVSRPNRAREKDVIRKAGIGPGISPEAVAPNTSRLEVSFGHDHDAWPSRNHGLPEEASVFLSA
jgi:hypothetical protein